MIPRPFDEPVYVVRPSLPPIETYIDALRGVWQRQWLSNNGALASEFERALSAYLGFANISVVNSGTTALILTFRAFELRGEVITTPFTSPATVNALTWCGLTPVFADIDPLRLTLDPDAARRAITAKTSAIVPVHVYGIPCDVVALQEVADERGLHLIYDGAHAFGEEIDGLPLAAFGDATSLSFHATKLFTSAEGGAVAARDPRIKERIDLLRNLGIRSETEVIIAGLNGRMNELQAALGLANLPLVEEERRKRLAVLDAYVEELSGLDGVDCRLASNTERRLVQYFPVRIVGDASRLSRDRLYELLKGFNVFSRRYFYPLCSEHDPYRGLPSSDPSNLPVAKAVSKEILCLPFYGALRASGARRVAEIIRYLVTTA